MARRQESRGDDVADEPCAVIDALDQIGSKWRLVVINDLTDGEKRFNELKRSTGASSRTLSRVLDDLGEAGIVDRRFEEAAPVATYYSLTPKGGALCPVFDAIEDWAAAWGGADAESGATDAEPERVDTGRAGIDAPAGSD